MNPVMLRHHRVSLALHQLQSGPGRPLLVLHGLGSATSSTPPLASGLWTGPIYGLDFTGHGASTLPIGGGYSAELLMGDVDTALAHLGPVTILGYGLGGYIALLIAGARPRLVRGAIITDGPGITGGPPGPGAHAIIQTIDRPGQVPDGWALIELSRDPRPGDYAISFVRQAVVGSGLDHPIAVSARSRPTWLLAVADDPSILDTSVDEALTYYASLADTAD